MTVLLFAKKRRVKVALNCLICIHLVCIDEDTKGFHKLISMLSRVLWCKSVGSGHRETSRDALIESIVSTENLSVCLRL